MKSKIIAIGRGFLVILLTLAVLESALLAFMSYLLLVMAPFR